MNARPTYPQHYRWSVLLDWLREGRPLTTRHAASELGVSRRTVASDLDRMQAQGVPLAWCSREGTYRLTEPFGTLPLLSMTGAELAAFLVAEHALGALGDGHTAALLGAVRDRLASMLPEAVRVEPGLIARAVRVHTVPAPSPPHFHFALTEAVEARRVVSIRYRANSTGALTERDVDPLALVLHAGRWYLVAWCHLRDGLRDFRLNRIEALRQTGAEYAPRVDAAGRPFDLDEYLSRSFGMHRGDRTYAVHLRFSPYQARWMREDAWHPTQVLAERVDGSLDLRMHVSGLADVARWALSYGQEVEVIAPAVLRRRVAKEARAMAARYALTPANDDV